MNALSPEKISKIMRSVKSSNTKIEKTLRQALWNEGIRYRKNFKDLAGKPDIVLTKYKIAIFCDGSFWHGRNASQNRVHSNKKFWDEKVKRNKERDLENTIELRDQGWIVLRFWEEEIVENLSSCILQIKNAIEIRIKETIK